MKNLDRYLTKKNIDISIIFFSVILGIYMQWEYFSIAYLLVFTMVVLGYIKRELLNKMGLIALLLSLLLSVIKRISYSDDFALAGFYLTALALFINISNSWMKNEENRQ